MEPIYEAIQCEEWAYRMAITLSFVLTKCIPSNCPTFRGAVAIFGPKLNLLLYHFLFTLAHFTAGLLDTKFIATFSGHFQLYIFVIIKNVSLLDQTSRLLS